MLLLARIVPFLPLSLVGYVAGAARVPLWRYTWTSTVGIIPITAAATYLGHSIDDFSFSDPLVWVALGVLVALLGVDGARAPPRARGRVGGARRVGLR